QHGERLRGGRQFGDDFRRRARELKSWYDGAVLHRHTHDKVPGTEFVLDVGSGRRARLDPGFDHLGVGLLLRRIVRASRARPEERDTERRAEQGCHAFHWFAPEEDETCSRRGGALAEAGGPTVAPHRRSYFAPRRGVNRNDARRA